MVVEQKYYQENNLHFQSYKQQVDYQYYRNQNFEPIITPYE